MLVFVYGTLKRGFGANGFLREGEFLGETLSPENYGLVHLGGFPGAVRVPGCKILGEVYSVPDYLLDSLDMYEGYPSLYTRDLIDTDLGEAWMYIYNRQDRDSSRCPSPGIHTWEGSEMGVVVKQH